MKKTAVAFSLSLILAAGNAWSAPANISTIMAKAEQGDVASMLEAGRYCLTNNDAARGVLFLNRVIQEGGANAAYAHTALGIHYETLGTSSLATEAMVNHFRSAAVAGDVVAQSRLGRHYLARATRADAKPAERQALGSQAQLLLSHAATAGNDVEAAYALGQALVNGDGMVKDVTRGEALLTKAAGRHHAGALYLLGVNALARGDAAAGTKHLEASAKIGSGAAMMALARAYESGTGVPVDLELAARWVGKASAVNAAGAGELKARIGELQNARMVAARPAQPVAAPTRVAYQPTGDANYDRLQRDNEELRLQLTQITQMLARMQGGSAAPARAEAPATYAQPEAYVAPDAAYAANDPVEQVDHRDPNQLGLAAHARGDYREAYKQFAKAAKRGNADAMNNQGMLLLQGSGVAASPSTALDLFRKAAAQGHVTAARNIAYVYENGIGVTQDLARSRVWYQHSAALSAKVARMSTMAGL